MITFCKNIIPHKFLPNLISLSDKTICSNFYNSCYSIFLQFLTLIFILVKYFLIELVVYFRNLYDESGLYTKSFISPNLSNT